MDDDYTKSEWAVIKRMKLCAFLFLFFVVVLIGLIVASPLIFTESAFNASEQEVKQNSGQFITAIINDPSHQNVKLEKNNDDTSLHATWHLGKWQWLSVTNASSNDLGRLALTVYDGPSYDTYKIDKNDTDEIKAKFLKDKKIIYTIYFENH